MTNDNTDNGNVVTSDRDRPLRLSRTVWILAALGALAIHAGGVALALGYMEPDDPDENLGAPAIAIGVEIMSPHVDPDNLPVGPDTAAAAPAPSVVPQKTVVEPTELPKAAPTETDDPDRVVSPADEKKPTDDDPKMTTVQADPSEESVPTEATAKPTVDNAPESPRSVTPSLGTGTSSVRERVTWQKELSAPISTSTSAIRRTGSRRTRKSSSASSSIG